MRMSTISRPMLKPAPIAELAGPVLLPIPTGSSSFASSLGRDVPGSLGSELLLEPQLPVVLLLAQTDSRKPVVKSGVPLA